MLTGTKHTFQTHPSLLTLQKALSAAESAVPCRPPQTDSNEQLAIQLIARMQADYKKTFPFLNLQDIPSPRNVRTHLHEMAGMHA